MLPEQIIIIPIRSCKIREALTNSQHKWFLQAQISLTSETAWVKALASPHRTISTTHLKASTSNSPSLLVQASLPIKPHVHNLLILSMRSLLKLHKQSCFSSKNSQRRPNNLVSFSRVRTIQLVLMLYKLLSRRRPLSRGRSLTLALA